jgi:hypothetical protein
MRKPFKLEIIGQGIIKEGQDMTGTSGREGQGIPAT